MVGSIRFNTGKLFRNLERASPYLRRRRKRGIEGMGPDIVLRRSRLRRYRGERRDSSLWETLLAAGFAALALGFYVRGFGQSVSDYMSSAFMVLGLVALVCIWISSLRTAWKILWSIAPMAGVVPYLPFV